MPAGRPSFDTNRRELRTVRVSWAQLYEQIAACQKCRLCQTRNNVVPGEGDRKSTRDSILSRTTRA